MVFCEGAFSDFENTENLLIFLSTFLYLIVENTGDQSLNSIHLVKFGSASCNTVSITNAVKAIAFCLKENQKQLTKKPSKP